MIYSLNGILLHKAEGLAVIECGGVGYACRVSGQTLDRLGEIGTTVRVLTHMNVREDCVELFGFSDSTEMSCFRQLISVNGVGAKAALAILTSLQPQQIALAVAAGDIKAFTRIKGIGAKLSQRIALELKDKLSKENAASAPAASVSEGTSDAIAALTVLGFGVSEIMPVIASLEPGLSTSEIIRQALRCFSERK